MGLGLKVNDAISEVYDDAMSIGLKLAESKIEQGGWGEYFADVSDIDEMCAQPGNTSKVDEVVAQTALLLENEKRNLMAMSEDTRSMTVGGFQDMLFPIIRAAFPTNPILDMVSVQPMTRKHGQVFFMDYIVGQSKGQYTAGQRFFDSQSGYAGGFHFSDEYVEREQIGTGDGSTLVVSSTLAYAGNGGEGIRPGTVSIVGVDNNGTDTVEIRDNGAGQLVQVGGSDITDLDTANSDINYATGAIVLTFNTGDALEVGPVYASYEYNSEGSTNLPTIDVRLATTPITAQRRALRYRYSVEAQQDFQAEFNRNIDEDVAAGIAAAITTEQAREVLYDLWNAAGAPFASFDMFHNSATAGYPQRDHFGDLHHPLNQVINQMYQETQRNRANWMVVDVNFANVLMTLGAPYFTAWNQAQIETDTLGIKFIGTWGGSGNQVRVYMDSLLDQFPGASPHGNAILGYKGSDFRDVAYIWAPYRLLYVTPQTTLDDMVARKAMASRVGRKLVNPRLIKRFELTNSGGN